MSISPSITFSPQYCRTHNVSVCLYIAYIACGSASLYIKALYFFLTVLALSVAATVANRKIRYDAKIPQFALFGTPVIYVFYSIVWKWKICKQSFVRGTIEYVCKNIGSKSTKINLFLLRSKLECTFSSNFKNVRPSKMTITYLVWNLSMFWISIWYECTPKAIVMVSGIDVPSCTLCEHDC